jgi:uncharacterized protein
VLLNVLDKLRLDGWQNPLTGLGTALLDKTRAALHHRESDRSDKYWEDLYDGDGMARRIAEKLPDEMTRGGFDLSMGDEPDAHDTASALLAELKRLDARGKCKDGMVWERVFGGSAVVIGADDRVLNPALPLNEASLRRITHLTAVDKPRIRADRWYPGTHPKAGCPETYVIQSLDGSREGTGVEVHESRLLIFPGGRVTHRRRVEQGGWGQSVLKSIHDILSEYNMSWSALSHMLQSANQEVWTLKNFLAAVAGGDAAMLEYFKGRMSMSSMMSGPNRPVILDADQEKYERFPSEFAGIPDTIREMAQRVSAVADMPMTLLFGMSPAGLNATGESDLQWWYETTAAKQTEKLAPHMERLIRLLMLCKEGPTRGKVLDQWELKFRPLKQMTAIEHETLRKTVAERDKTYVDAQILLPEEIATNRFRPEGWSAETKIDLTARERILAAELAEPDDADDPDDPTLDDDEDTPPTGKAPASGDTSVQDTALNGAQVASLLEVIKAVAAKQIPRATGVQVLIRAFQLSEDEAEKLMGDVGDGFVVAPKPEPAPIGGDPAKPVPPKLEAEPPDDDEPGP